MAINGFRLWSFASSPFGEFAIVVSKNLENCVKELTFAYLNYTLNIHYNIYIGKRYGPLFPHLVSCLFLCLYVLKI